MITTLIEGVLETRSNFILAAGAVCTLTAATMLLLMRNADIATRQQRIFAAIWVAIVAGVGVWTTHFVAMLGYRPDAALTYDLQLTLISIVVGVLLVGVPLAGTMFITEDRTRIVFGMIAGLGVAAMHLTGMSAIENCLATYNPFVLALGVIAGMGGFTFAMLQDLSVHGSHLRKGAGIVGGVCALHFVAMAAVSLDQVEAAVRGIGGSFLSILVAIISLAVFTMAMLATFNHRRTLAQLRAGV
ncbi:MAG: MHYT domain-containing protein [Pseudomonadota bacterium]|nr:MHYT domain-containing protein [Pseudomonadota bacterium]MEC9104887.1 MHYT domain-containing protein [Pseudomonadota bacterium]